MCPGITHGSNDKNRVDPAQGLILFMVRNLVISTLLILSCSSDAGKTISTKKPETPGEPNAVLVVKQGDVLGVLLSRYLHAQDYNNALRALDSVVGATRIKPGDTIKVFLQEDRLSRLEYIRGFRTRVITFSENGFSVNTVIPDFHIRIEYVQGSVKSSLWFAFQDLGEKPGLLIKYADIFGWDVDFATETQLGDSFFVMVEKKYLKDTLAGYGRVLWARYKGTSVGDHRAWYYRGEYYDDTGTSLRKSFLKSPLKVYRITSRFTERRYHPILKIYRPHHGVDYAAPRGTPVHALGDGVVTFAGWKGGYGKYIRIKHPNEFQTGYGHLSRIAVSAGQTVKQGQVIGYVGATGLATGPHLHFEMFKSGRFVNPLAVDLPPAEPIPQDRMPDFLKTKELIASYVPVAKAEFEAGLTGP